MSEVACGPAAAAGQQEEAVDGMLHGRSDSELLPLLLTHFLFYLLMS